MQELEIRPRKRNWKEKGRLEPFQLRIFWAAAERILGEESFSPPPLLPFSHLLCLSASLFFTPFLPFSPSYPSHTVQKPGDPLLLHRRR